tara:strand:+ start:3913 stop:4392 length:480 start_codon:yes stop_codon:yes gene_type:complete
MSFLYNTSHCDSINNFDSLVPLIENESFNLLLDIYSNVINDFDSFKNDERCINNQYIKIKVVESDWFECFLIVWKKNAVSKIHDHSENGCLYKVISGCLREEQFSNINLNKLSEKDLDEGCINYIDNQIGYHRMSNQNSDISVSIHFYSPKNYSMNVYD